MITCETKETIETLIRALAHKYKEVSVTRGKILNYLGMTLDFRTPKQVKITMAHCVDGILSKCGVIK